MIKTNARRRDFLFSVSVYAQTGLLRLCSAVIDIFSKALYEKPITTFLFRYTTDLERRLPFSFYISFASPTLASCSFFSVHFPSNSVIYSPLWCLNYFGNAKGDVRLNVSDFQQATIQCSSWLWNSTLYTTLEVKIASVKRLNVAITWGYKRY